jgi:hypothetical protein
MSKSIQYPVMSRSRQKSVISRSEATRNLSLFIIDGPVKSPDFPKAAWHRADALQDSG